MFLDAESCVINSELVPVPLPLSSTSPSLSALHPPLPFITPLIKPAHPERTDFKGGRGRGGNG